MSTAKSASVKMKELLDEGVRVEAVWGDDYHLTVDLDTPESIRVFPVLLKALNGLRPAKLVDTWTSRSGKGQHHYIQLDRRTSFQERAAMQAFLGSDPLREMLGFFDVNNVMEQDPFVLFRPQGVGPAPKPIGATLNDEGTPF